MPIDVATVAFLPDGNRVVVVPAGVSDVIGPVSSAPLDLFSYSGAGADVVQRVELSSARGDVVLAVHPDGGRIAVAGEDGLHAAPLGGHGNAEFSLGLKAGLARLNLRTASVRSIAWSPSGSLALATVREDHWGIEMIAEDGTTRQVPATACTSPPMEVGELRLAGWLDGRRAVVWRVAGGDRPRERAQLYVADLDGRACLTRIGSIPADAAPFVADREVLEVDADGLVRTVAGGHERAVLDLPAVHWGRARRQILAAVAVAARGRLAVAITDAMSLSVLHDAPSCTQILLFEGVSFANPGVPRTAP